ncbi:MAG: M4 family metallopeptidase [Acidobacteria bacterium]|nr:M4 family metallopeptidase [Acidobacteriota bacterium]
MKRLGIPILAGVFLGVSLSAQRPLDLRAIQPVSLADLRAWDAQVTQLARDGDLRVTSLEPDTLIDGRAHERLAQHHRGVRVVGADVARQLDQSGKAVSMFGMLYADIDVDVTPGLTVDEAKTLVERISGQALGPALTPELVILPLQDRFVLGYRGRAATEDDIRVYYLDANTGDVVLSYSDMESQQATAVVGSGTGVLSDPQKMSVSLLSGVFYAVDALRPPVSLITFDMKGDLNRVMDFLNGRVSLGLTDRAQRSDNAWTDPVVVDAHAYAGYTYDYYFKRFGRRGLNDNNSRMLLLVHPVRREDYGGASSSVRGSYYQNAFYSGSGVVVLGEGLPTNIRDSSGRAWTYLAGSLDVVAHELTHGVTGFTSNLIYMNESGALNESFSDMMGTSAEFFFQQPGSGLLRADYILGEDVITTGIRSMLNPRAFGHPDHYSLRFTGTTDNGGVHSNSGISNHAFYLAIEGGTNRTSGLSVQGVGAGNREQIERVFYRAFTQMLPSNATFAVARAATIQAARDLYGAGSAPERAITQGWTAVGVQ